MARHLYLMQRAVKPPRDAEDLPTWVDCCAYGPTTDRGPSAFRTRGEAVTDQFGNVGFPTVEEARKELEHFRKAHPSNYYRIIQIVA